MSDSSDSTLSNINVVEYQPPTDQPAVQQRPQRSTAGTLPSRYRDLVMLPMYLFYSGAYQSIKMAQRKNGPKPGDFDAKDLAMEQAAFQANTNPLQVLNINEEDPITLEEALRSPHKDQWVHGLEDEMKSLVKRGVLELVEPPPGARILDGKYVFKIKRDASGAPIRFKVRFVIKGYRQIQGIDFWETYAGTVKAMAYRLILALVAQYDLDCEHIDVKTAFLYGDIEEEIYCYIPPGFKWLNTYFNTKKA